MNKETSNTENDIDEEITEEMINKITFGNEMPTYIQKIFKKISLDGAIKLTNMIGRSVTLFKPEDIDDNTYFYQNNKEKFEEDDVEKEDKLHLKIEIIKDLRDKWKEISDSKKNEIEGIEGFRNLLKRYSTGFYIYYSPTRVKSDGTIAVMDELNFAYFQSIEKEKCLIYDIEDDNITHKTRWKFMINDKVEYVYDEKKLTTMLRKGLLSGSYAKYIDNRLDDDFVKIMKSFPNINIKSTNCWGFYKNTYHDYPEWDAYCKTIIRDGGKMIIENTPLLPPDWYRKFIKLQIDDEKKNKCVEIINNHYCRNEEEKHIVKITLAFSVASVCKILLYQHNINVHPIYIIIGDKQTGKTTASRIFLTDIWNKTEMNKQNLEGRKGSRMKQFIGDCFPLYVDEAKTFGNLLVDLKSACTGLGLKIIRGDKQQNEMTWTLHSNICTSCNDYHTDDEALAQRHIIQEYPVFTKKNDNAENINYLEQNIKHLGKAIYNDLINFDFENIIKQIREKYKNYSYRDLDRITYIKIGEEILNKFGILNNIEIDTDKIIEQKAKTLTNTKDIIMDIISRNVKDCKHDRFDKQLMTVGRTMNEKQIDKSTFEKFASKGIYINSNFTKIIIGKQIIPDINVELKKNKINILKNEIGILADLLEMKDECKTHKYIKSNINLTYDKDNGYTIDEDNKITSTITGILFSPETLINMSEDEIELNEKQKDGLDFRLPKEEEEGFNRLISV